MQTSLFRTVVPLFADAKIDTKLTLQKYLSKKNNSFCQLY